MDYPLCSDTKRQSIFEKVITILEQKIKDLNTEYTKYNTEILNLNKFIDYAFPIRRNLFIIWKLQGLEKKETSKTSIPERILLWQK